MKALQLTDVTILRGGRPVVEDLSLQIAAGEITALLGANGAGKSSLVLGVAGLLRASRGRIVVDGRDVTGLRPQQIRRSGIAAVPEGHEVLRSMSVRDNLRAAVLEPQRERRQLEATYGLLPELRAVEDRCAKDLSGGQQQMVAIAQGLMSEPTYLLIDELSLGLAPVIVARLVALLAQVAATGIGVLLIEQYASVALAVADHAAVIDRGRLVWAGAPVQLVDHPEILHGVYLGSDQTKTLSISNDRHHDRSNGTVATHLEETLR